MKTIRRTALVCLLLAGCATGQTTGQSIAQAVRCIAAQASALRRDLLAAKACTKAHDTQSTEDVVACVEDTTDAGLGHVQALPACMPPEAPPVTSTAPPASGP